MAGKWQSYVEGSQSKAFPVHVHLTCNRYESQPISCNFNLGILYFLQWSIFLISKVLRLRRGERETLVLGKWESWTESLEVTVPGQFQLPE